MTRVSRQQLPVSDPDGSLDRRVPQGLRGLRVELERCVGCGRGRPGLGLVQVLGHRPPGLGL